MEKVVCETRRICDTSQQIGSRYKRVNDNRSYKQIKYSILKVVRSFKWTIHESNGNNLRPNQKSRFVFINFSVNFVTSECDVNINASKRTADESMGL